MAELHTIPDTAIPYILFQRTGYLRLPVTFLYRHLFRFLPFSTPIYNLAVAIESRVGRKRVKALYAQDMEQEYHTIKHVLPQTCSAVLDIGCGVAGIDVFIYRHYLPRHVTFYLLDKSHIEQNVYYMFKSRAAFYNSLDVARVLLAENGVPEAQIHLLEVGEPNNIRCPAQVDVVLSLLSWGFHYPVQTYVDQVYEHLSDHGIVVLDVRKGTDGLQVLQKKFPDLQIILETNKGQRIVARK